MTHTEEIKKDFVGNDRLCHSLKVAEKKINWLIWICAPVTIAMIYVLSAGPVYGIYRNSRTGNPKFVDAIYTPLGIVVGTPLEQPLYSYIGWWMQPTEEELKHLDELNEVMNASTTDKSSTQDER